MHRSKEIYGEDANEFRPERWKGPELKNIGFGFMPFHGGPRLCLGSKIQLLHLFDIVKALLCLVDIENLFSNGFSLFYRGLCTPRGIVRTCACHSGLPRLENGAGHSTGDSWEGEAEFNYCCFKC